MSVYLRIYVLSLVIVSCAVSADVPENVKVRINEYHFDVVV